MSYNNVNVNVSGPKQPTSTYKTKVLKGNHSFASQVTEPNTKYVIKHNFDLGGGTIIIPEGCLLEFDGGSLSNGTLVGDKTAIKAGLIKIFNTDIEISGDWNIDEAYPEWFGAKGDGITDDSVSFAKTVQSFNNVKICKEYRVLINSVVINHELELFGTGFESAIITDSVEPGTEESNIVIETTAHIYIHDCSFKSTADKYPAIYYHNGILDAPFRTSNVYAVRVIGAECIIDNVYFENESVLRLNAGSIGTVRNCKGVGIPMFLFIHGSTAYLENNNVVLAGLYTYYHYVYAYANSTVYSKNNYIKNDNIQFDIYHFMRGGYSEEDPTQYLFAENEHIDCNVRYLSQSYKSELNFTGCIINQDYDVTKATVEFNYGSDSLLIQNTPLVNAIFKNCDINCNKQGDINNTVALLTAFYNCNIDNKSNIVLFGRNAIISNSNIKTLGHLCCGEYINVTDSVIECANLYRWNFDIEDVILENNVVRYVNRGSETANYAIRSESADVSKLFCRNNVFEGYANIIQSGSNFTEANFVRNILFGLAEKGSIANIPSKYQSSVGNLFLADTCGLCFRTHDGWKTFEGFTVKKKIGNINQRPALEQGADIGFTYFDTTIRRYIVWNGDCWVDNNGDPLTKFHVEIDDFVKQHTVTTNQAVGSEVPMTLIGSANMDYVLFPVNNGDVIKVVGVGGSTERLYAVLERTNTGTEQSPVYKYTMVSKKSVGGTTLDIPINDIIVITVPDNKEYFVLVNVYNENKTPAYNNYAEEPYKVVRYYNS